MTLETSLIFFISLVLLWLKPGPGQALRLTYAMKYGFIRAFAISLGVLTICLGYFLFVAFGYSALSSSSLVILLGLKVLGALYLLYLGIIGLVKARNKEALEAPNVAEKKAQSLIKDYSLGLLMALSNPITIFYFVGILPTLVPVGELAMQDMMMGLILIIVAAILVDGMLLLLTVLTKEAFAGGRFFKYIGTLTSLSFIVIGLFLLYAALFMEDGLVFSVL